MLRSMRMWVVRVLAVGLCAAWVSGCLSARKFTTARYDPATDEFTVLNVYEGIKAENPAELDYLYNLWRNRGHIIHVPQIAIFEEPAYLRLPGGKFAQINLGQAPESLTPADSPVPLDAIRVLPGTFFLQDADTLCYYDQVVIPGKVVDQVLPLLSKNAGPDSVEAISKEMKRRREGGKTVSWDVFRQWAIERVHSMAQTQEAKAAAPQPAEPPEGIDNPLRVIDDQSLQGLLKGMADASLQIKRDRQTLSLTLPLSAADSLQIAALWRAVCQTITVDAPTTRPDSGTGFVSKLMPAFKVAAQADGVRITVDLGVIFARLRELEELSPRSKPDDQQLTLMRNTVASMRGRGAAIDENLKVEEVMKGFESATLKAHPSAQPVEPGTGLASPAGKAAP